MSWDLNTHNKAIAVIEKPFSLDELDHIINSTKISEKLEKISINQEEKKIKQKVSEIVTVFENQI